MHIFHLIFSGLLDLAFLPVFLCYEYIIRTQKKIISLARKTQDCMASVGRIRMSEKGHGIIKEYFS